MSAQQLEFGRLFHGHMLSVDYGVSSRTGGGILRKRDALRRSISRGWGPWVPHSLSEFGWSGGNLFDTPEQVGVKDGCGAFEFSMINMLSTICTTCPVDPVIHEFSVVFMMRL